MSLERTYRSISNLENEKRISAAQLFEFIIGFIAEAYKHNGVKGVSGLEMGDREDLILHAFALSDMLLSVVKKNEDVILRRDDAAELQEVFSQIEDIQQKLSKKCDETKELKEQKAKLQEDYDKAVVRKEEAESEYESVKKEKEALEAGIQELEKKKDQCEAWIAEFRKSNPEMVKHMEEYSARYREISTAVNCVFNEEFIREHLFSSKENSGKPTTESYPDLDLFTDEIKNTEDLRRWVDALQKRIESLIDVYQEELRRMIDCSDRITAEI